MNERRGFLLFLTSCLCGCGQMYQGYMKRGLSLLLAIFTLIAVAGFLSLGPLAFFTPVVWLYAFFDSYNLRRLIAQDAAPEDAYLFGLSDMDSQQMTALLKKRHSIIGWVLVIVGVYMLYDTVIRRLGGVLWDWLYYFLCYDLPRVIMTVLVILLGLWFIRGPKAVPEDEIPPFTPPVPGGPEPVRTTPESGAAVENSAEEASGEAPQQPASTVTDEGISPEEGGDTCGNA